MRTWLLLAVGVSMGGFAGVGDDWPRFRGPDGSGIGASKGTPLRWSDTERVRWKTDLPGPGGSSPITVGSRIFLTCYTGYGPGIAGGDLGALQRHLLALDRATGKVLWNRAIPADPPEQAQIREDHGYATSTPVADAERVYVFFGKSGVFAFDHEGQPLWHAGVGDGLNGWGSASSPVLHGDLLLVNASVESGACVALDRRSGREVWRAKDVTDSWHAPVVVTSATGTSEVVLAMSRRVLGFDAASGEPLWHCETGIYWYICPTPVVEGDRVYVVGGRGPAVTMAIRAGGRGAVDASHVLWKTSKGSNVPSPILHDGHLYYVHENLGVAVCVAAATGEVVYEERLSPGPGQVYASPVMAEGRIYYLGRGGRTVVVAAAPRLEVLAENVLEGGRGEFLASPALDGAHLLIRSRRALYSLGED